MFILTFNVSLLHVILAWQFSKLYLAWFSWCVLITRVAWSAPQIMTISQALATALVLPKLKYEWQGAFLIYILPIMSKKPNEFIYANKGGDLQNCQREFMRTNFRGKWKNARTHQPDTLCGRPNSGRSKALISVTKYFWGIAWPIWPLCFG